MHIDTGLGNPAGALSAAFQGLLLTPVWTIVVWLTHALAVAIDWAYSLDLLGGSHADVVARTLRGAEQAFTVPWLTPVLAVASIATAYRGLVQRRVSDAVAAAGSTALMVLVGLWLIAAPGASVGAASRWVNQAALGSLAAISGGPADGPERSLADGMTAVFDSAITAPWCYLEFGNVAWCREPGRLDPRLRAAARRLARADQVAAHCRLAKANTLACDPASATGTTADREIAAVREARSNGALFLAFPANGPARNSISDPNSLLRVICASADATACRGPTAAQAEFRTGHGAWARAGGLLLIAVGAFGMLALLGFLAIRLVGAALLCLLYLLVAPLAVLAPALGDSGRTVFRSWAARLLGALLAKLAYSVFLGVLLLAVRVLSHMGSLGWWTQWLLIAALWWVAFQHRHAVWRVAMLNHRDAVQRRLGASVQPRPARAAVALAHSTRARWRHRGRARVPTGGRLEDDPSRRRSPDQTASRRLTEGPAGGAAVRSDPRSGTGVGLTSGAVRSRAERFRQRRRQAGRLLAQWRGEAELAAADAGSAYPDSETGLGARITRVRHEQRRAQVAGDRRRTLRLAARAARLEHELATRAASGRTVSPPVKAPGPILAAGLADQRRAQKELDAQAKRARGISRGPRSGSGTYRDYARPAGLVGLSATHYRRLEPPAGRQARPEIDRQLDRRLGERPAQRSSAWIPTNLTLPWSRQSPRRARNETRVRAPGDAGASALEERLRRARQFGTVPRGDRPVGMRRDAAPPPTARSAGPGDTSGL